MAKRDFYIDIDLNGNQILGATFEHLATPPSNPFEGQNYYDSNLKLNGFWNGTKWVYGLEPFSSVPMLSFNINGYEYTINSNGLFTPWYVGGNGPPKYITDRQGYRWEINNDNNGELVKTRENTPSGGPRSFIPMILNNNVWMIGITNDGEFEPYDLST